ncbi:unnamed protein product, partial [Closterium sp. Naga37s-1]
MLQLTPATTWLLALSTETNLRPVPWQGFSVGSKVNAGGEPRRRPNGRPPPTLTSPPPTLTSPPPTLISPPPTLTSPPPTLTSPPPTLTSPPPTLTSPPPTLTSPPPTLTSPPPTLTSDSKTSQARLALAHSMAAGGKEGSSVLTAAQLGEVISALQAQVQAEALAHSMAAGGKEGSSVLTAAQLGEVISALQAQVQAEVATHHDELLQQLSSLKDTEGVLSVVRAGVDSLLASVQRVRAEIADPYQAIQVKTRQLAALYDTMELLRAVIKYLKLVRKLREHLSGGVEKAELGKAGQVWQEVGAVHREAQLGGVHVVEAQHEWVAEAGQAIRREAMRALEGGMEAMNQAEVGSVLQLRQTVDQLVAKHKGQAMRAVATGLDMKAISASMGASGGGGGMGGSVGGPVFPFLQVKNIVFIFFSRFFRILKKIMLSATCSGTQLVAFRAREPPYLLALPTPHHLPLSPPHPSPVTTNLPRTYPLGAPLSSFLPHQEEPCTEAIPQWAASPEPRRR